MLAEADGEVPQEIFLHMLPCAVFVLNAMTEQACFDESVDDLFLLLVCVSDRDNAGGDDACGKEADSEQVERGGVAPENSEGKIHKFTGPREAEQEYKGEQLPERHAGERIFFSGFAFLFAICHEILRFLAV